MEFADPQGESAQIGRPPTRVSWRIIALGAFLAVSLAGDHFWLAELLLHLRMHFLIAGVLFLIVGVWFRQWRSVGLSAAISTSLIMLLWPWLPALESKPKALMTAPQRVLFWNVNFQNSNAQQVLSIAEQQKIDVLVLLEYSPRMQRRAHELKREFPVYREHALNTPFGIAIFSRSEGQFDTFLLDESTPALRFQPTNQAIQIWGVHVFPPVNSAGWKQRNQQLEKLQRLVVGELSLGQEGVLIGGDFNLTPWSGRIQGLCEQLELKDLSRVHMYQPTWPSRLGIFGIPIDQALVSDSMNAQLEVLTSPDSTSDHRPVLVLWDDVTAKRSPMVLSRNTEIRAK